MARSLFTCQCGNTEWVSGGNKAAADSAAAHAERTGRLCKDCYAKQRAAERQAETEAAAQSAAENDLPALDGSPKQVAWAETIRAEQIAAIDAHVATLAGRASTPMPAVIADAIDAMRREPSASWWIDNRRTPAVDLVGRAMTGSHK